MPKGYYKEKCNTVCDNNLKSPEKGIYLNMAKA
jgi:hypothetical protein